MVRGRECHVIVDVENDAELWLIRFDGEARPLSSARVWSGSNEECRKVVYTADGHPLFLGVDTASLIAGGKACRVLDDRSMYSTGAAVTNDRLLMTNGRSLLEWEIPSRCAALPRSRTHEFRTSIGDVTASPVATALLVVNHDSTASVLTVDRNLHAVATLRLPPRGPWFIEGLAVGVAVFSHRSRKMWLITSETAATEYERPDLTRPAVPIALGGELRLFNGTTLGRHSRRWSRNSTVMTLHPRRCALSFAGSSSAGLQLPLRSMSSGADESHE
jgi:hypothetical protein